MTYGRGIGGNDAEYDKVYKLVLVGPEQGGKSALMDRFTLALFNINAPYFPTIGVGFDVKSLAINNKKIKLQIWDIAGQRRFLEITKTYYHGSAAIILAYDITHQDSLKNLEPFIEKISQMKEKLHGSYLYLVGTKADLADKRQITEAAAEQFAKDNGLQFVGEVSAKEGKGVEELFSRITNDLMRKDFENSNSNGQSPILVEAPQPSLAANSTQPTFWQNNRKAIMATAALVGLVLLGVAAFYLWPLIAGFLVAASMFSAATLGVAAATGTSFIVGGVLTAGISLLGLSSLGVIAYSCVQGIREKCSAWFAASSESNLLVESQQPSSQGAALQYSIGVSGLNDSGIDNSIPGEMLDSTTQQLVADVAAQVDAEENKKAVQQQPVSQGGTMGFFSRRFSPQPAVNRSPTDQPNQEDFKENNCAIL